MSNPPIKNRLASPELTGHPATVQAKLNACLATDSAHFTPGQVGPHVKVIQDVLGIIRSRNPGLGIPPIGDPPGSYGRDTAAAVKSYKASNAIVREGQQLDAIVGRMTLTRLDNELLNRQPPAPISPIVIQGVVEISTHADDLRKDDLAFGRVPNSELSGKELLLVTEMRQKTTRQLESLMLGDLMKGGRFGALFLDAFVRNSTPPSASFAIVHKPGSDFSNFRCRH
jgi:hypothetical protein